MASMATGKLTKIGSLSADGTLDVKSVLSNYASLSANDFILDIKSIQDKYTGWSYGTSHQFVMYQPVKTYNATTGVLTVSNLVHTQYCVYDSGSSVYRCPWVTTFTIDVYAFKG